jgi:hypothetical protein
MERGIDDCISDDMHAFRNTLERQSFALIFRGTKMKIRHYASENAISFFRHVPVIAAKTGFEMRNLDTHLMSRKRAAKNSIRIALHHDDAWFKLGKNVMQTVKHRSYLFGWRQRSDMDVI